MGSQLSEKSLDCLRLLSVRGEYADWARRYDRLCALYSQNAVEAKLERLAEKDYIDYGVSPRMGWLTEKGQRALEEAESPARTGRKVDA